MAIPGFASLFLVIIASAAAVVVVAFSPPPGGFRHRPAFLLFDDDRSALFFDANKIKKRTIHSSPSMQPKAETSNEDNGDSAANSNDDDDDDETTTTTGPPSSAAESKNDGVVKSDDDGVEKKKPLSSSSSKIPTEVLSSFGSMYLRAAEEARKEKEMLPSSRIRNKMLSSIKEHEEFEAEALRQRKQTGVLNCALGLAVLVWGRTLGIRFRLASSASLLYSGGLVFRNKRPLRGYKVANAASAVLTWVTGRKHFRFGERYLPTGLIATVASIALFYNLIDTVVAISEEQNEEEEGEHEQQQNNIRAAR